MKNCNQHIFTYMKYHSIFFLIYARLQMGFHCNFVKNIVENTPVFYRCTKCILCTFKIQKLSKSQLIGKHRSILHILLCIISH